MVKLKKLGVPIENVDISEDLTMNDNDSKGGFGYC